MNNNNTTTPKTTDTAPVTTPTTAPVTTPTTAPVTTPANKTRVIGSMTVGVPTSDIKFKSILELRREFGENWM